MMPFAPRSRFTWRLRTRSLPLGRRTLLMGIVNVTPDSFSRQHRFPMHDAAHDHSLRLLDEGADLLDLGGESTRPGSKPVSPTEEQDRVLPVLRSVLRDRPEAIVSVDTYHASTAALAMEAGAEIVNDVSGLLWDPAMAELLAREQPGAVLMHTRGAPRVWGALPPLPHSDILPLVISGLTHSLHLAHVAGIRSENIVIDPGFGFGKLGDENFVLLGHFFELKRFKMPLLAGLSRKRFLTAHLEDASEEDRLQATVGAHVAAILAGAHLLRVHDLHAARVAASVGDATLTTGQPEVAPRTDG